jgi:hypothetical protein
MLNCFPSEIEPKCRDYMRELLYAVSQRVLILQYVQLLMNYNKTMEKISGDWIRDEKKQMQHLYNGSS